MVIRARHGEDEVVRLMDGADVSGSLVDLGNEPALVTCGVGMVRSARLAYWNGSSYEEHEVDEPCELVSLQGNLGHTADGTTIAHCHACLAKRDGTLVGGHLVSAVAHNTVEIGIRWLGAIKLVRKPENTGLVGLYPAS